MNIILLSGGSGKRLWPLSNDVRSKQFIKFFKDKNGYESMLQRMYRQIKEIDHDCNMVIAASKSQASIIRNQLNDNVSISIEPTRRDTFPAIVLAVLYLKEVLGVNEDESVVVCPIDPYVEDKYFDSIKELSTITKDNGLYLMGINPTYPSEKYGYIIPTSKERISSVNFFKEKPAYDDAVEYIKAGALWNSGVFSFTIKYLLDLAHKLIHFSDYNDFYNIYETLEKISFDYAVVEKEKNIVVLRYEGSWKDVGTWNTLTESISDSSVGNCLQHNNTNVHIINELEIPIVACGLKDVVIAASPEGILVSDKIESTAIKSLVESMEQQRVMFGEKSWGNYTIINIGEKSITIKADLKAGHAMSYHMHQFREEVWIVVSGYGEVVINDTVKQIKTGDTIRIESGTKHMLKAISDLEIIEIQIGDFVDTKDKIKFSL